MEKQESIEFYKWCCPECRGQCSVISLGDDFKYEVDSLNKDTMLPQVELEILESLHEEATAMKAGEIAALIDVTYQLVGRRTSKLHEMGLVNKTMTGDGRRSIITDKARLGYFTKYSNKAEKIA